MDFEFTPEQQAFRRQVCSFLRQELSPERVRAHRDPNEFSGLQPQFANQVRRGLGEGGFLGRGLPPQYGGGGLGLLFDLICAEELEYHGLLVAEGSITYLPYSLLTLGNEEQKQAFLPRLCRGEARFFLGYSEPEAGSDLANLKASAQPQGRGFLLSGEKLFASDAHLADYGWVAARTDPTAPKHKGISLFIVDMHSPGISITSHPTIAGWLHPAVHFDGVFVPASGLVGELNRGWEHIMEAIDYERLFLSSPGQVERSFHRLLVYCRENSTSPAVNHRLVDLAVEVEATRLLYYWAGSLAQQGVRPLPQASLSLLVKRETARLLDSAALELLGPYLQLKAGSPLAPYDGEMEREYKENLYFHFAAGGFDITRNVIARRLAGLPREG